MNTVELMKFRNETNLPKLSNLVMNNLKTSVNGIVRLPRKVNDKGICNRWSALYKLQIKGLINVKFAGKTLIISKGAKYNA